MESMAWSCLPLTRVSSLLKNPSRFSSTLLSVSTFPSAAYLKHSNRLYYHRTTPLSFMAGGAHHGYTTLPFSSPRLAYLEKQANAYLQDPILQAAYMKEANKNDPRITIRRFELGYIAINEAVVKQYLHALCQLDRLDTINLESILNSSISKVKTDNHLDSDSSTAIKQESKYSPTTREQVQFRLDPSQPMRVSLVESHRGNIWKFLRSTAALLIGLAAFSVFAEGLSKNMQKGFGIGSKKPEFVEDCKTTFEDIKGIDDVKNEILEVVMYLKDPKKFTEMGAKLPKGLLLSGAPGTGKTLMARAIAGEAQVPFIQTSGSEFDEMFVGVGARRIRDLFSLARKHAPCIIFVDEVDAVGSKRSSRDTTAARMTLNQLLVELDGFEPSEGIIVICATNDPESLDKALTRPGRLDKTIIVPFPDLKGRAEILKLHAQNLTLAKNVDLDVIARRTAGMTGADLYNILNIATIRSCAEGNTTVDMNSIELAFDRVVVGLERRNPMSDEEKKMTAYHEGGHALVNLYTAGTDPVHKATIMPRGHSLGTTWMIPTTERFSQKLYEIQGSLDTMMGGKAAEEVIYGEQEVTAGCMSDLQGATQLARRMVMQYGMGMESSSVPMYIDPSTYGSLSEDIRRSVDRNVQRLLDESYVRARDILIEHISELHHIAEALVDYETLSFDEIKMAMQGQKDTIRDLRSKAKSD